ncbi:hypothetical protein PM8797T_19161 [Gimesia maris DSM 8797]|nr:hypothetical protein PM8797T_19161 [Gimesia maris DSM 8797]
MKIYIAESLVEITFLSQDRFSSSI